MYKSIASMAALALGMPFVREHHMGRSRYSSGQKPTRSRYLPHQGKREIARRKAQAARNEQRQRARAAQDPYFAKWGINRKSRRGLAVED